MCLEFMNYFVDIYLLAERILILLQLFIPYIGSSIPNPEPLMFTNTTC